LIAPLTNKLVKLVHPWASKLQINQLLFGRAKKPYYNYTNIAGRIIAENTIRFNNQFFHKSRRLKEALRLTRERRQLFIGQIKDIREELKQWQINQRACELHLVETKYMKGNTQVFSPRFAAIDIAAATNKVKHNNALEARNKINMWFIGWPAREDLSKGTTSNSAHALAIVKPWFGTNLVS
jgi:hypothetical protein